jgi:hypothetical protein
MSVGEIQMLDGLVSTHWFIPFREENQVVSDESKKPQALGIKVDS